MTEFVSFASLTLLLASIALWVYAARQWAIGHTPLAFEPRWQPEEWPRGPVLFTLFWVAFVLFSQLLMVSAETAPAIAEPDPSESVAEASQATVSVLYASIAEKAAVGLLLFGLLTRFRSDRAAVFGVHLRSIGIQLRDGTAIFVASLAPTLLMLFIISPLRTEENTHSLLRMLTDDGSVSVILAVVLAAVVLAAFAEELMFRVVLQDWLGAQMSPRSAIVVTALLFAAVHGFPDAIALLPLSLLLGYLYWRKHSYISNVVAHSLFNGFMIALTLFAQE